MRPPRGPIVPGWILFVLFVPLNIWLFLELKDAWGLLYTSLAFLLLGLLAARAARPRRLLAALFPGRADRRLRWRPVLLAALALAAAASWLLPWGPQPWLPLLAGAMGAKALLG